MSRDIWIMPRKNMAYPDDCKHSDYCAQKERADNTKPSVNSRPSFKI